MNLLGDKLSKKYDLLEIGLLLVTVTMLFDNNLNSYTIIAFCALALIHNKFREKVRNLRQNPLSWLLPLFYFSWIALSCIWDRSGDYSIHLLEGYASFLVFPIMLGSVGPLKKGAIKRTLLVFTATTLVASWYCLYQAYLVYKAYNNYSDFLFYHHLSMHIGLNAIYFSMFCLFSIVVLVYYYFFMRVSWWIRLPVIVLLVYLIFFMLLLASKMFIFLLCLTAIGLIGYICVYYRKLLLGLGVLLIFTATVALLLNKFNYTKGRIEDTRIKSYAGSVDNDNGAAVRSFLWHSAIDIFRHENKLIGMGHFTAQDSLRTRYKLAGFSEGVKGNYNSHNQYLYALICYGFIGLLLLLGFLSGFVWNSCRAGFIPGIVLSLFFILSNITECMLETQKGIVFFLFFSSLLTFNHISKPAIAISANNEPDPDKEDMAKNNVAI